LPVFRFSFRGVGFSADTPQGFFNLGKRRQKATRFGSYRRSAVCRTGLEREGNNGAAKLNMIPPEHCLRVSGSFMFENGDHIGAHQAGTDLTDAIGEAPHG